MTRPEKRSERKYVLHRRASRPNVPKGVVLIPHHRFEAYTTLFHGMHIFEVIRLLNREWVDPRLELVVRRRE